MKALDPTIAAYYERGQERDRLFGGSPYGPLELARTQELLARHLDSSNLRVADVGGGPGVYAAWLSELGHEVHLIDPVALHVDQVRAAQPDVHASVGDARELPWEDGVFDVVLLLGPLYHLQERDDRLSALSEARRVAKDGGRLFAAAISRFAALLDMLVRLDTLHLPDVLEVASHAVQTGEFRGVASGFTSAYFHHDDELLAELEAAGFEDAQVFNVEGPGVLVPDFEARWGDPERREAMLAAARLTEREPGLSGASSHLLGVARATGRNASTAHGGLDPTTPGSGRGSH